MQKRLLYSHVLYLQGPPVPCEYVKIKSTPKKTKLVWLISLTEPGNIRGPLLALAQCHKLKESFSVEKYVGQDLQDSLTVPRYNLL